MKKSGTLSFKSDGPCPRAHPWKALKTRKYLFYLESMHLQWTEYFAKLFTGIKKGAHAGFLGAPSMARPKIPRRGIFVRAIDGAPKNPA